MTFRAASHDPRCRYVWGGTFHSFANQVIREFADVLGISPAFRILDSVDASEAIGRCQPADAPGIGNARLPNPQTQRLIFSKSATTGPRVIFADSIRQQASHHPAADTAIPAGRPAGLATFGRHKPRHR